MFLDCLNPIQSIEKASTTEIERALFSCQSLLNLIPNHIIHAIKYHKFNSIKEYIANDRNLNSVDVDGNNILMLILKSVFKDANYVNKDNVSYIKEIIELILLEPFFDKHHKNDFGETVIGICRECLGICKKNKCAQSLLKSIIFYISNAKTKPVVVIQNDEVVKRPMSPKSQQQNCVIL